MAPASFCVRRHDPVLVAPSSPTPHEFKPLSDIDDQRGLRFRVPSVLFFRSSPSPSARGRDPAKVVKEALAKALVFYYPLAGRLREGPNGKLVVECNAEGVVFVEADADVRLDQFGDLSREPVPCVEELICDVVEGSGEIVGSPVLLFQVTRLLCGGFILGNRLSHPMADGQGFIRFMQAVAEMARGLDEPSVRPVWARELLSARDPPRITHMHPEYQHHDHDITTTTTNNSEEEEEPLVHRSFFFGPKEISALKSRLPPHMRSAGCSRLEVVMACVWRSRSIALYSGAPGEPVRLVCVVDARGKTPPLPEGYYGNVLAFPAAESTAGRLESGGLGYAVELVRRAKGGVTDGYLRSVADLMAARGRPGLVEERAYMVSDLTKVGSGRVDFGWGEPVFSAAGRGAVMHHSFGASFFSAGHKRTNAGKGEEGVVVPMCLPRKAMERFMVEIESIIITSNSLILSSNL